MRMRSLRWNLVVWKPSVGPADPFGAPGFAHLAWTVRARRRPIFLVTGALLMATGLMLPSTVAFIAGMLVVGSSAPAAPLRSPTAAMVRAWVWLHKGQGDHDSR
jgi:hypothetical protein